MKVRMSQCIVAVAVLALCVPVFAQSDIAKLEAGNELLPPAAKPGECYARVYVSPKYGTETERVLTREASSRVEIVPAKYEWVTERVLVKEASKRLEVVPAKYEWVEERMLVKPAAKKIVEVPAQWETVTERVLDRPAHTVWKKGTGPLQKVDNATGEIMCLVEVPATYKTVTKRVLKAAATTREVEIPAEYKTVKKQVMSNPPSTREIEIPAVYDTVKTRRLVKDAESRTIEIPAEYKTVTRTIQTTDGRMEWATVLCETNATRGTIMSIQRALKAAGYNPGDIDGVIGTDTMNAVRSYQKAKGLAQGYLTYETIDALGVKL
ncbi:hypothetical protein ABI59_12625 [Acidobacteria bacterium Mor1]|nr:hypothetical protein ABI59_12625 [Acidobacteria bacterium Mor1]